MAAGNGTSGQTRRGFTLIEMLTVLLILSIVLTIIIPAVAGGRTAARRADTVNLMSDVGKAGLAFAVDERRPPGYFTPVDMGSNVNGTTVGFTMMENIMLDLIGGITTNTSSTTAIEVGPFPVGDSKNVWIDTAQLGGSNQSSTGVVKKGYFQFDSKRFVVQNDLIPGGRRMAAGPSDPRSVFSNPVLVDTFSSPVLAWQQDEAPAAADTFAKESATTALRARFYWSSNAGFLQSTKLGKLANDQTDASSGSLLSKGTVAAAASREASLGGLLGNPSAPLATDTTKPASGRGSIVLHSAGQGGVFLGRGERGGKVAAGQSNQVRFTKDQDPVTGGAFDDILQSGELNGTSI